MSKIEYFLIMFFVFALSTSLFAAFPGENGKIAFVNGDGYICTMNSDGQTIQVLTHGYGPSWSADGSKIVFYDYGIWTMNTDGTGLTQVTLGEGTEPSFSPDGTKILFRWDGQGGVWVVNSDGTDEHCLTCSYSQTISNPEGAVWSPDGTKIAFDGGFDGSNPTSNVYNLFTIDPDGSNLVQITQDTETNGQFTWNYYSNWSPDSKEIVFIHEEHSFDDLHHSWKISSVHADGTNRSVILNSAENYTDPAWSPDGQKIVLDSGNTTYWNGPVTSLAVYSMSRDGTNLTKLTADSISAYWPDWQPIVSTFSYAFKGFFQPVDNSNPPSYVFNVAKAGSSIPVKFSLTGNQGMDILASGSPSSQAVNCEAATLFDTVEETTTSKSGLQYDLVSDQYTYVWATQKSWVGTCRKLNVKLKDGRDHTAYFKFK